MKLTHNLQSDNVTDLYQQLIGRLMAEGVMEAKTYELRGVTLVLENPELSIVNEKKNWKWAFQELIDRLASYYDYDYLSNPGFAWRHRHHWKKKLIKEGGKFDYAYGEMFGGYDLSHNNQIEAASNLLRKKKADREAVISIWKPDYLIKRENYQRRPCTLTLNFYIRDGQLWCFTNMRSNDLINLLPYDIFHHTFIQRLIAHNLGIEVGPYVHSAAHMYCQKRRMSEERNYINPLYYRLEEAYHETKDQKPTPLGPTFHDDMNSIYDYLDGLGTETLEGMSDSVKREPTYSILFDRIQSPFLTKLLKYLSGENKVYNF